MRQFTNLEKANVLDEVKRQGGVSKVAEKFGITRATIYNWQKKEAEIRDSLSQDMALEAVKQSLGETGAVLDSVGSYAELLERTGDLERRKKYLSAQVEFILWKVVRALESHEDLTKIHPKDMSKIMTDLHAVRKDLSNEPTVIIEYRNTWLELVLQVLREFLDEEQLRDFVSKMEAVEADYEVLK